MKIKSISKHVLAIVLSLAVLASTLMLNTFSAFAEETLAEPDIWDGTIAQPTDPENPYSVYDSGTGTELDPYIISTPEQLAYLVATIPTGGTIPNQTNHYFRLKNDIYLNNVESPTWYNNAGNKEWYSKDQNSKDFQNHSSFLGTLDGAGHTIYGLYFNRDATSVTDRWLGLFPILRGTIKNLRISSSYVSTKDTNNNVTVGAFAACVRGTTAKIINCVVDDTTVRGYMVGGFVGSFNEPAGDTKVVIDGCYSKATVITTFTWSTKRLNRMFVGEYRSKVSNGKTNTVEIKNSYAVGDVDLAPPAVEAVEGTNGAFVTTITSSYTTKSDSTEAGVTVRTLSEMTGAKAKVYMNAFDFKNVWYTEAGKTPQLRFGNTDIVNATELWRVWSGTVPETVTYDGGAGTQASPYEISNAEQLAYIVSKGSSGYYKLTDDIYLNDVSVDGWYKAENNPKEWIGTERKLSWGNFDGDGHTVYGLYLNAETQEEFGGYCGLFPCLVRGTISNIRISKSYVKCMKYDGSYGVLVGHAWSGSTITNCVIDETVEFIAAGRGAALIGAMEGTDKSITVDGCYVGAKLSTTHSELPGAFFGKPFTNSSMNYEETSHLIIKNSYCAAEGDYVLAKAAAAAPVKYENCYTTKVYDAEQEGTAPAGVTAGATLEEMKTAGLSTVLKEFPKLGNVNDDDAASVDICDLVTLKKLELGMAVVLDIYGSDVNNDREINGLDYLALQKYILNDLSVFQ